MGARPIPRVLLHGAVLLFVAVFLLVRHDYGVTWDSALGEFYIGDKNAGFYLTLDPAFLDYDADTIARYHEPGEPDFFARSEYVRRNYNHVWPLGPVLSSVSKRIFAWKLGVLDVFEGHHLANCFLGVLLAYALYAFLAVKGSEWAALFAVIALFTYPRFWADIPNNLKDVPSTVFFSLTIFAAAKGVTAGRPGMVLASGAIAGMALAAKANAVFLPLILVPWLAAFWIEQRRSGRSIRRSVLLAAALAPCLALVVMLVLWPKLLCDFPTNFAGHLEFLVLHGGRGPKHFQTGPLWMAISTMPESMMVLVALGLGKMLLENARGQRPASETILTLAWLVIPVLRVSWPGALDFDGIRHWLEFTVPLAALAGRGADGIRSAILPMFSASRSRVRAVERGQEGSGAGAIPGLAAGLVAGVVSFSLPVFENVQIHPHQVCYFNRLSGRLAGARRGGVPRATDYWGSSYREGERWLNEHAPPGSILIVPIGEHIVQLTAATWLRPDIRVVDARLLGAYLTRRNELWTELGRPAMYMMELVGHDFARADVLDAEREFPPAYVRTVGGADILRILILEQRGEREAVSQGSGP